MSTLSPSKTIKDNQKFSYTCNPKDGSGDPVLDGTVNVTAVPTGKLNIVPNPDGRSGFIESIPGQIAASVAVTFTNATPGAGTDTLTVTVQSGLAASVNTTLGPNEPR